MPLPIPCGRVSTGPRWSDAIAVAGSAYGTVRWLPCRCSAGVVVPQLCHEHFVVLGAVVDHSVSSSALLYEARFGEGPLRASVVDRGTPEATGLEAAHLAGAADALELALPSENAEHPH